MRQSYNLPDILKAQELAIQQKNLVFFKAIKKMALASVIAGSRHVSGKTSR